MNLRGEKKKNIDLEKDLLLTRADFCAIGTPLPHEPEDLDSYLDFLDELWGSVRKETEKRFYPEPFQL